MTVGILSSVPYDDKMASAFQDGFVSFPAVLPALPLPTQADVGFDGDDLDLAIQNLLGVAGPAVNMIVTFGGVAACNRMIASKSLPFVSLVGTSSYLTVTGLFKGCVTLDDIMEDVGRVKWLGNHVNGAVGGPSSSGGNIGLYYNNATKWGSDEAADFTGASTVAASQATLTNPVKGNFYNDFKIFPAGTRAVVVSASGFFHENREPLIAAANKYGAYFCYPLMTYKNSDGTNQPTPGDAVIYGVDLDGRYSSDVNSAYYLMGVMAATVWNAGACNGTPNPPTQNANAYRVVKQL
jgi:hypothetical protein